MLPESLLRVGAQGRINCPAGSSRASRPWNKTHAHVYKGCCPAPRFSASSHPPQPKCHRCGWGGAACLLLAKGLPLSRCAPPQTTAASAGHRLLRAAGRGPSPLMHVFPREHCFQWRFRQHPLRVPTHKGPSSTGCLRFAPSELPVISQTVLKVWEETKGT